MDHNGEASGRLPAAADRHKKILWALLSALIAALTVWAVSAQWKDFSLRALAQSLAGAKPGWMLTLMMYALSILVVGLLGLIFCPSVFLSFSPLAKLLIVAGSVIQILLALVFFLLFRRFFIHLY